MTDEIRSVLVGTLGLTIAAIAALVLTVTRGGIDADPTGLRAAVRNLIVAVLVQAVHFTEEFATGFHRRLPQLLGLGAWPDGFFVSFNLLWLAIWMHSIQGLLARRTMALFPVWFLGLASVGNGLAHPTLAAVTGGYFPGLITSPFIGVIGILLLRRLFLITGHPAAGSQRC
jgi:hypothetical protein